MHGNERLCLADSQLVPEEGVLIVNGTVDREGRLIAADPRLLALQRGAGGEEGGPLVVPQIAALARLARTLGILVSRGVVAADGADDLDLWVRARPEGELVELAIAGWDARPEPKPDPVSSMPRDVHFARLESDGDWGCDTRLRLSDVTPDLLSLAGVDAVSVLGQPVTRFFRLIENEDGDLPLLEAAAERQSFVGQRAELRELPGVQILLHGDPVTGESGDFEGFSGGYRIVERSLVPARRVAPTDIAPDDGLAKRLDSALRGPLGRIIANADSISGQGEGPLRHDYADYASDISTAGRHLLGLVDDLVDLQAVEKQDFSVETEPLDLADIARRASGLLGVRAADRSVRIDAPPADEELMAMGDFRRVLQILVNLVSNAVRYSPAGSSVWVRTEEEGDLAAIIVADQGKGIAIADQDRIFEKFERVDPSEPGGSGLGLFISRRLARAMGGDITVDSAPGQGARFVLTLPVSPKP